MSVVGTQSTFRHTPVLLEQTLELLRVTVGGTYCDATIGGGGHTRAILERSAPNGRVLGIDRDPEAVEHSRLALSGFGDRLLVKRGNLADTRAIVDHVGWAPVDGVLADLGVSSYQLDTASRGFSFAAEGPLDMRMGPDAGRTAGQLIEDLREEELARVIRELGEERYAKRVARAIKFALRAGRLASTGQLRDAVCSAIPRTPGPRPRVHPATRSFQALRMAVNDEIGCLERFLDSVVDAVRPGGTVVVISFHSLEDRAVKRRFAALARPTAHPAVMPPPPTARLLTRKPVRPTESEVQANPRARSARLRAVEKLR